MHILIFQVIQVFLGILLSIFIGRRLRPTGNIDAVLSSAFSAFAIGVCLSLISPLLVARFCTEVLSIERGCLSTDDTTVWFLAIPLIATPVFFTALLVAIWQERTAKKNG